MPGTDKTIPQLIEKVTLDADDVFEISDSVSVSSKKVKESTIKSEVLGELENLTTVEIQQLENINVATISVTQWGYVGVLDQSLTSTSSVSFNNVTIEEAQPYTLGNPAIDGAWRIIRSGDDLKFERLESSAWVEKGSFEA